MKHEITIIGGDRRFLSVRDFFVKKGYKVGTVFFGREKNDTVNGTVILPVPVFRNGFLNAPMTEKKIDEDTVANLLIDNSVVFGGIIPELFKEKCKEKNISFIDYYNDENLLNENAALTAKAVPFVLEENKIPLRNGKIYVLGYGRCGKAIAGELSSAGGNVTVVTGKLCAEKYSFIHFDELGEKLSDAALVVNTVPSTVLSEGELRKLNRNAVIIEIASAPYGIDFDAAAEFGIKVIKAPALPGKYFPDEAGIAVAKTIFKEMN